MFCYQMVALADQNGKTYECEYGTYNKENGFQIKNFGVSNDFEDMLYDFFHKDMWSLKVEPKVMTKEEIKNIYGNIIGKHTSYFKDFGFMLSAIVPCKKSVPEQRNIGNINRVSFRKFRNLIIKRLIARSEPKHYRKILYGFLKFRKLPFSRFIPGNNKGSYRCRYQGQK